MREEHFYALLGEFLFALAFSDGFIQEEEIRELEKLVREELHDPAGDKEVIFTKLRFFNCLNVNPGLKKSADAFLTFCRENRRHITRHQLQLALKLTDRIEHAYKGALPPETSLLKQLEEVLGEK